MYLIHINITKNNIIISITTLQGNVILQKTAGSAKFRSEESNTQLTTSLLASYIAEAAKKNKINLVGIYIKGTTDWKVEALTSLLDNGCFKILFINDISNPPHNGCYKKKKKRKKKHSKLKL